MTAKTDMDRVGLFKELGYTTIGDPYKSSYKTAFNDAATKGRQLLAPHSKEKCSLQDGYFDRKFTRVFEGEAYTDAIKRRRQQRMDASKLNIAKPFIPSHGTVDICGVGNYYGSFSGVINSFAPALKTLNVPKTTLKNVQTNPGKKGTGYGYPKVTINEFRKHMPDPYATHRDIYSKELTTHKSSMKGGPFRLNMHPVDYFHKNPFGASDKALPMRKIREESKKEKEKPFKYSSPGKMMAGDKSGTFDKYPSHSTDVYKPVMMHRKWHVVNNTGKLFYPNAHGKSRPVNSIMQQNIMKEMNVSNYRSYTAMSASF